jgi:short-subunit dehydrogenase
MATRGTGQVINVASAGGFFTGPGCATYCATKGYLISFSQSVQADLAGTDLRVQALCPGFILTEFHDTRRMKDFERSRIPKYLWLSPGVVVRESLRQLRRKRHRVICIPTLRYRLLTALMRNSLVQWISKKLFGDRIRR